MSLFEELNLSSELLKVIKILGYSRPTQIQELSIPHIITGKDVIGESATGSGKTLAFGSGIVEKTDPIRRLQALVLTPTRELAEQVSVSLRGLSRQKRLNVISVYGGVSIAPQIHELKRADVVVATPGRLLDHLNRRTIDTSNVRILVLDEADRMLDMGFIDDVEEIIRACPKNRQTMFFSATISPRIRDLANRYMNDPIMVSATRLVDPSKLKQNYIEVAKNMKLSLLAHLLLNEKTKLAMVFCNTRRTTDFVAKNLRANRINATAIHGGLSQNKRTKTMKRFNNSDSGVLICTDVAARGLHIESVSHVYNYEIPKDSTDYVHRIGRTARAGEMGKVINLLCNHDHDNLRRIERDYPKFKIESVKQPYLKNIATVKPEGRRRFSGKKFYPQPKWR